MTYRRTSRAAAAAIIAHDVDLTRSRGGAYGQGFYTATDPDVFYGDTDVSVAVRTMKPLAGELDEIELQLDPRVRRLSRGTGRLTSEVADTLRHELLDLGYDSILVVDGGGDGIDYVIALDPRGVG